MSGKYLLANFHTKNPCHHEVKGNQQQGTVLALWTQDQRFYLNLFLYFSLSLYEYIWKERDGGGRGKGGDSERERERREENSGERERERKTATPPFMNDFHHPSAEVKLRNTT